MVMTLAADKVRPLNHYALVKVERPGEKGGVLLPDGVKAAEYETARVMALGPGVKDEPVPEGLKVGDRVVIVPGPFVLIDKHRMLFLVPYGSMVAIVE